MKEKYVRVGGDIKKDAHISWNIESLGSKIYYIWVYQQTMLIVLVSGNNNDIEIPFTTYFFFLKSN